MKKKKTTKKASPAQLASRKKFLDMIKSKKGAKSDGTDSEVKSVKKVSKGVKKAKKSIKGSAPRGTVRDLSKLGL